MTIFRKEMENWEYNLTKDRLKDFISKNFDIQHNEFETWVPPDWIKNPKFLNSIKDEKLKDFACKINRIWKDLGRKIKDDVRLKPELYSLIYLPHLVIIPGGREDIEKAEHFKTESGKENFYSKLKAAAESVWDFSSRWFILNDTNKGK
ncbi:hypothetical protein QTP88_018941 [Uroleucon formosanum]